MGSLLKSLKRQDGFTLVELMVVVAIIGLLSAVAVPNFKKYQAKAKITEAKLQLSAAYTAEQSFFSDYNMYHNCLSYMGFDPGPESANRYYAIGFDVDSDIDDAAYNSAVNSGLNATGCPDVNVATSGALGAASVANATWFPAGKGVGSVIANTIAHVGTGILLDQSNDSNMQFSVAAGGVIAAGFTTAGTNSQLNINERKIIANVTNGF